MSAVIINNPLRPHDEGTPAPVGDEPDSRSLGRLVGDLTEQVPDLIRAELRLAQAEVAEKGKRLGIGAGMLGAAGVVALFAVGTALAAAILALAEVVDGWLAALIVTAGLLVVAGFLAVVGQAQVKRGAPPVPKRAIEGLSDDVAVLKEVRP
ncbi:phage holin family protein [Marmoricola sp. OAE513]|uniref:phage holin family protein n=1 Tax=Marmoricola sp. OAE513 TaxID=2817894 RepID=UPI001AE60D5B